MPKSRLKIIGYVSSQGLGSFFYRHSYYIGLKLAFMKKIIILLLCFLCNGLFAHIDRPIDALIFEGKTYDTYSLPLNSFVKNDRQLKRKLLSNPVNHRIPKHYYATFEIKDNKLYLNKIELIVISERSMRLWKFPLALNYTLKKIPAPEIFGKKTSYPIFCKWYTGKLFATIFDGTRGTKYLFDENYYFEFENGKYIGNFKFETRTAQSKYVSMPEAHLMHKFFSDKSFTADNKLFDLRCIDNLNLLSPEEFSLIKDGQAFKTRGYFSLDEKKRPRLSIPKTRNTPAQSLSLINMLSHDISDFKNGDRVEATLTLNPNIYSRIGLLSLSHLEDDELIHSPDFFLR